MSFDHSKRTTKFFSPLGGPCVCEHCKLLPWHEGQAVPPVIGDVHGDHEITAEGVEMYRDRVHP